MRDTFATIAQWLDEGWGVALATLVETYESSPSPLGTTVAVDSSGRIAGNIGAGCHEGEVVEACRATLTDGQFRVLRINLTDDDVIEGGTGCGGALKIAIWRPQASFAGEARAIARGADERSVTLEQGLSATYPPKRRLVIVGATTLAEEVAHLAKALDYFVIVVDPRPLFATRERLPNADEISLEWPDEILPHELDRASAVLVLSHDPKFDIPALACALRSNVPYIGLLGSRRSQASRRDALRERGIDEALFARIHGPVGLDLGGETNAETALSILAEIVAAQHGGSGSRLSRSDSAIHRARQLL